MVRDPLRELARQRGAGLARAALALFALAACGSPDVVHVREVLDTSGARFSDAQLDEALRAAADLVRVHGGRELRLERLPLVRTGPAWPALLAEVPEPALLVTNAEVAPLFTSGRALVSFAGRTPAQAGALAAHALALVLATGGCLAAEPGPDLEAFVASLRARRDCRR